MGEKALKRRFSFSSLQNEKKLFLSGDFVEDIIVAYKKR